MGAFKSVRDFIDDDYFSKARWNETLHNTVRYFPLLASLIAPLSVLYDIPALSQPWYGYEEQPLTDEKTSLILSSLSLFCNLVANLCLLLRFTIASRRGYMLATRVSMIFWIFKACIALINLIIFGVYKNNESGYIYLEGFWCAVISCILSCISMLVLLTHYIYEFDPKVALRNNEVRLRGRGFMLNVTFLVVHIGLAALIFSRIEKWTYLEGIYFSTVSILTVGFGDYSPTTTAGKILLFPLVLLGIAQLAVVVSQIIDFFSQRSLDITRATKLHIERERLRKETSKDTIDLNEELILLEDAQKMEDKRTELISLSYSLIAFCILWLIGALIFSRIEGWTYGNGLYFNYVFFLTLGYGDYSPATSAGRSVFILYALIAVPVMTSFAVQSVTKAMSIMSEHHIIQTQRKIHTWPDPIPHHHLLDEADKELHREKHRRKLNHILVDSVLQMDLATRKLLSIGLEGHPKLLLKADTLVQLRNTNYDINHFVDQFHDVQVSEELANYRKRFAQFLTAASALLGLEGDEERLFQRRMKDGAKMESRSESRSNNSGDPPSRSTTSFDMPRDSQNSASSSRHGDGNSMQDQEDLEFHMGQSREASEPGEAEDAKAAEEAEHAEDANEGKEEWSHPFERKRRDGHSRALQSVGLSDNHRDREQEDEHRDV